MNYDTKCLDDNVSDITNRTQYRHKRLQTMLIVYENIENKYIDFHRDSLIKQYVIKLLIKFKIKNERIISYQNPMRKYWDRFILVLAIINSLFVPIQLSFSPPEFSTASYQVFDSFVDIFFLGDVVLKFYTTY